MKSRPFNVQNSNNKWKLPMKTCASITKRYFIKVMEPKDRKRCSVKCEPTPTFSKIRCHCSLVVSGNRLGLSIGGRVAERPGRRHGCSDSSLHQSMGQFSIKHATILIYSFSLFACGHRSLASLRTVYGTCWTLKSSDHNFYVPCYWSR